MTGVQTCALPIYLITGYLPAESCEIYFNGERSVQEKQMMANKITHLLKGLADLFIAHGDLKASNILIKDDQPYLIDLDSMRQYSNSKTCARASMKDWNRFIRNWENDTNIAQFFIKK